MSNAKDKPSTADGTLAMSEARNKWLRFWWYTHWTCHQWAVGLSFISALAVPFGLAMLLYVKAEELRTTVNLWLLGLSGFSVLLQGLDHALRWGDRYKLMRREQTRLELAIAAFRDGHLTAADFIQRVDECFRDAAEEQL